MSVVTMVIHILSLQLPGRVGGGESREEHAKGDRSRGARSLVLLRLGFLAIHGEIASRLTWVSNNSFLTTVKSLHFVKGFAIYVTVCKIRNHIKVAYLHLNVIIL